MKIPGFTLLLLLASCWRPLGGAAADMPMFSLVGPVETLTVQYASSEGNWDTQYSFDEKGMLTAVENVPVEVKRDAQGRIASYLDEEEDEDGEIQKIVTTLTYNPDGTVASTMSGIDEDQYADTYYYEGGRCIKHESEAPDEEGDIEIFTFTYKYSDKVDEYGNWLMRREISSTAGDPVVTQTRVISYRK